MKNRVAHLEAHLLLILKESNDELEQVEKIFAEKEVELAALMEDDDDDPELGCLKRLREQEIECLASRIERIKAVAELYREPFDTEDDMDHYTLALIQLKQDVVNVKGLYLECLRERDADLVERNRLLQERRELRMENDALMSALDDNDMRDLPTPSANAYKDLLDEIDVQRNNWRRCEQAREAEEKDSDDESVDYEQLSSLEHAELLSQVKEVLAKNEYLQVSPMLRPSFPSVGQLGFHEVLSNPVRILFQFS